MFSFSIKRFINNLRGGGMGGGIKASSPSSFYDFSFNGINGSPIPIELYENHPVIAVNVATKCGLTQSNYTQLADLMNKFYDSGLRTILFPCNQFANQEPGDSCQIEGFANQFLKEDIGKESDSKSNIEKNSHGGDRDFNGETKRGIQWIISEKIQVNGSDAHPAWVWLKNQASGFLTDSIKWNFTKFLIDKQGKVVKRYGPNEDPKNMEEEIKKLLA